MKSDIYCLRCEKMVLAETDFAGRLFHMNTVRINNSPDPGDRYDLCSCYFPDGYAHCPPPVFDLEAYIEQNGEPSEIVECEHLHVDVKWKLYARETRFEHAEYIGKAQCQDCGLWMEPEDISAEAERKEETVY